MPMQIAMFHFLAELNYPIIDRLYLSPLLRGGRGCVIVRPITSFNTPLIPSQEGNWLLPAL